MKLLNLAALSLCLAACSNPDPEAVDVPAADQARAAEVLASIRAARAQENWEGAETLADELRRQYPGSEAAQSLAPMLAELREKAEASREQRRLRELWTYQSVPVGKAEQHTAAVYSKTAPVGEGEPAPTPDAQLILRDHPAWGRSAYLLLGQSRFRCGSPCAMRIAFDAAEPTRWAGKQADSGKGPALFIEDEAAFQKAMSQAKEVQILLPEDSGSLRSLRFEVSGFQAARYDKP